MRQTRVSVVVVAFGETPLLGGCVEHILASAGVEVDLAIVDNGSTDGSLRGLDRRDDVRVLTPGKNIGFGAAGNLAAAEIGYATDQVIAFVNPDVLIDPDALQRLAETAMRPGVGIASASVRLLREPSLINSAGGLIHFLGLGWSDGFRHNASEFEASRAVAAASGAAMALRAEVFRDLHGFTEEFFLYHEDAELSWRCWMVGLEVRYVADALVLHDYEFARNLRKLELLERNRLLFVLTCYSARTLWILFPALLVFEIGMALLAASQGWAAAKFRGWFWIIRHLRWITAQRKRVQSERRRTDRELAPLLAARFTGQQVSFPSWLRAPDFSLSIYWRSVQRWI